MRPLILLILFLSSKALAGQISVDNAFERTKGTWRLPIDKITKIDTQLSSPGYRIICFPRGLTVQSDSCVNAYFVQPGQVVLVTTIGTEYVTITKQGSYYLVYSGFAEISVKKGDKVIAGQLIGSLAEVDDNVFELEILLSKGDKSDQHIDRWFCSDFQKLISHPIN